MSKFALCIPAALLWLAGCASDSGMMGESRPMAETRPMAAEPSLYTRLGGQEAIAAVVDDFVGNVAKDKRINHFFRNTDIPRLKQLLVEQICAGSGGPCTYTGRDMQTTHKGMHITDAQFSALVEDLGKSLNTFKVPAREQQDLLAILGPMKPAIVGQ